MSLSREEIKEIITLIDGSGWDEAVITIGDVTVALSKSGGPSLFASGGLPAPQPTGGLPQESVATPPYDRPAPAPGTAAPDVESGGEGIAAAAGPPGTTVTAPSVGVFWRSPEPGAPPFVEVGDDVVPGTALCIIEIMKLMQHVEAPTAGTISAVHVDNGESVEHGTPLFTLIPTGS